jgi:hypothetical protein
MGLCLEILTLMALAHGAANAQGEARWSWQELHAWEFGGQFLEDFAGRKRPADGGEAGAIVEEGAADARATGPVIRSTASGSAGAGVVP